MATLDRLNAVLGMLQQHAATLGITLAGLMVGIYCMLIMLSHDTSVTANRNRWDQLQKVLICAGIIAATGAFVQFAQGIGQLL